MTKHGHFHWNELMSWDVEGAKQFYSKILEWKFDTVPGPHNKPYCIAKIGDKPVGGIFALNKKQHGDLSESWFTFIAVDNVDSRVKKIAEAGGKVLRPPLDIEGFGRVAVILDAGGAALALITPANP
ncbi:MAG: VOC family protein [Alphaproteobacteria bacterium]